MIKKETNIISPENKSFIKFMHELKKENKVSKLTKRDEKFAILAESDGWKEFKDMLADEIERLMSLRDYEASGRDLSELGLRFLVADLVSDKLETLVRRVDQAKELYDQEQREKNRTT